MLSSPLPFILTLTPFIFAILICAAGEKKRVLRDILVICAATVTFLMAAWMVPIVVRDNISLHFTLYMLNFKAHPLGTSIAAMASLLFIFTSFYSFGYMASGHTHALTRYYACFIIAMGATMGILYAGDLFTLFLFYEILTVSVYPLVIHDETEEAIRSGRVYLIFLLTAGVLILLGIGIVYNHTGGHIAWVKGGIMTIYGFDLNLSTAVFLFLLLLTGFGVKAAIMPLHRWLPLAMVAPTPISAVLHAVAVVKVGVFGMLVIIYMIFGTGLMKELGFAYILSWAAAFTIITASIFALREDSIKKRLAYSTVSQLSYITLGASILHPVALTGAVVHILFHSLMKIVLFFCAGLIITQTGRTRISEMGGLGREMPITMACFTIGALGMIGLPPVAGWISKWTLMMGMFKAGQPIFVIVLLLSAVLNMGYFIPPVYTAYFEKGKGRFETPLLTTKLEAPLPMLVPTVIISAFSVIFGLWASVPYWFADRIVEAIF